MRCSLRLHRGSRKVRRHEPGRAPSFQDIILRLHAFWASQGCVILQPYDVEMGAGTFHPATTLRALGPEAVAGGLCPAQPPGPSDGRYGENPNRLQHYYQYQVIMKPAPDTAQALMLASYAAIGLDPALHDIRFVEDDWESPTLGAWGLGWEGLVRRDGRWGNSPISSRSAAFRSRCHRSR